MAFDKDEIKRRVSINQVLTHYGSPPDNKGKFRCPFPQNAGSILEVA